LPGTRQGKEHVEALVFLRTVQAVPTEALRSLRQALRQLRQNARSSCGGTRGRSSKNVVYTLFNERYKSAILYGWRFCFK